MTRRFFMVLLIASVAVLSGRPLLICTMNMASAAQETGHCKKPAPVDTGCMVEVETPSGLPSAENTPTVDVFQAVAYQLAPVLNLAPRFHAAVRYEPIRYESPPASIQILRI